MKQKLLTFGLTLLLGAMAQPMNAQVSNDNEDEVNKVDQRFAKEFVPGQVLVKFKDESTIQVQRTAKGQFRAASISKVDQLLRNYGVKDMEKLFPAEVSKPKTKLRRKAAPNGTIVEEKNLDKVFWVKTNIQRPDSTLQLIEQLKAMPEVEYAEPNYYAYITADVPTNYATETPAQQQNIIRRAPVATETTATTICSNPSSNPLYFRQYGITQQNIHKLWNKPIINKKRPVIAILDSGVDINHPDLADNIWSNTAEVEGENAFDDDGNGIVDDKYGWNFVDNYYDLTDRNGHGTHVAGIAAAADNNIGIVGANPQALIMPVKVMNDRGEGDMATIARGIVYAAENGADVINMSFGGPDLSLTIKNAIDKAYQTSILVASAGNDGLDIYTNKPPYYGTCYPAAYYLVLGVEASGSNLQRAGFSNYDPDGPIYSEDGIDGRNYEVMVPGDKIYSTLPDGKYNQLSGTSMSAPLFAGAISALQMVKDYPSKDVLFGDLIHLKADFEKIYNDDTPRIPKIDLVSLSVDDNVEGNSNIDGQVDVGETIKFTPVLRNTWADATDITISLAVDPIYTEYVEIENPEVPFGYSLSAYGRSSAHTPIRVRFADDIGDNTRIKFVLSVSCAEGVESFTQDVYVTVNNMVKISGVISKDRILTANHTYYVNDNLGIMEGATLTIEPGTRLEFAESKGLFSFGKLVAKGTPECPIVFTIYRGGKWTGIKSHSSTGVHHHEACLYTNEDNTLFTLLPTELTPNRWSNGSSYSKPIWYGSNDANVNKEFYLIHYIKDWNSDMTARQNLLTDPNYLTPAILQALSDLEDYCSIYASEPSEDKPYQTYINLFFPSWDIYDNPKDKISYCIIENFVNTGEKYEAPSPYMSDCIIKQSGYSGAYVDLPYYGLRNQYINSGIRSSLLHGIKYCNIVNNTAAIPEYSGLHYNNYFNNNLNSYEDVNWIEHISSTPSIDKSEEPSYLGTSRQDIVLQHFQGGTFGQVDLSNMPTRPYAEAHGIVWKVVVNGYDAQDEYEQLPPLGVAKHKFEVYFNRPMNKKKTPQITFGVREPYTQHTVDEEGDGSGWNEEGTIYTAYKTISGRTLSDGVNRIYVQGAEDNEFFECPYEKTRFNINLQAAGSMATGFAAEAGLGKVKLTWNNSENNFEDAMGFNIYRFNPNVMRTIPRHRDENGKWVEETQVVDTVCINKDIVDLETTEFIDYDVTPGETYYYMYKVLSTDLKEYDVSNVVAATPLTSELGDANGDGDVDVSDVITTVNYAAGMEPKPFIYEAADINKDLSIDILDVIGIIQKILNPGAADARVMAEATATYTIEDGVLYVESPVELAGVQVQIALNENGEMRNEKLVTAEDLKGFEQASAWLTENDYLLLAYNMSGKTLTAGKHALLTIGDGELTTLRLSDALGHNVAAVAGEGVTKVDAMGSKVMNAKGIYNLNGQKIVNTQLRKGVYIVNGQKIVK